MQWSAGRNGGFSAAPAAHVAVPIVAGALGPGRVNVMRQLADERSLLNWLARAVRVHARCPEIGEGSWQPVASELRSLLALRYRLDRRELVVIHNFSPEPAQTTLDLDGGRLEQLLGDRDYGATKRNAVDLDAYGYRWLRVERD